MVFFYLCLVAFLARYDAALLNLSILTAGMYVALGESICNGRLAIPSFLYGIGFMLVMIGSAGYHKFQV